MATLFGKETLEGGSLPATFDSQATYDSVTGTIDNTSKIVGVYSFRNDSTLDGGSYLVKALSSDVTEIYYQFKVFIPTGYVFGASGYVGIFEFMDNADAQRIRCNIEDYGTVRMTFGGDVAYTDTGINLSTNTVVKVEVYIKKSATVGEIKVWINNDVSGSPTFSATGLNTAATAMRKLHAGMYYTPDAVGSLWFDDFILSDTFIGAGTTSSSVGFFSIM